MYKQLSIYNVVKCSYLNVTHNLVDEIKTINTAPGPKTIVIESKTNFKNLVNINSTIVKGGFLTFKSTKQNIT